MKKYPGPRQKTKPKIQWEINFFTFFYYRSKHSEVKNLVAQDEQMRAKVEGVIRGARLVKSYPVGDTYATELELDMKLVFDLYRINTRPRKIKNVEYY